MEIRDDPENGMTFEGIGGQIFVTRDRIGISGGAVDAPYRTRRPRPSWWFSQG